MRIDSVKFRCRGEKMVGVRFAPELAQGKCPAVLMLHGCPGAQKNTDIAYGLTKRGFICLLPHFRGSWGSRGRYSFSGLLQDAGAALKFLRQDPQVSSKRVMILGYSMGGWVALNMAAKDKRIRAVAALAPMAGAQEWLNADSRRKVFELVSILDFKSKYFLWNDFKKAISTQNPLDSIHKISPRPVLFVHGTKDDLLPLSLSQRLYQQAGRPKRLIVIGGADHGFTEHREILVKTVVRWVSSIRF